MFWIWATLAALLLLLAIALRLPASRASQRRELDHAMREFRLRREMLEAKFFDLAVRLGKPRGVRWVDCDWQSEVRFARDRQSGLLTAFVAVNIRFEAEQGSDMADVEFVTALRDAAAVFHYQNGMWGTGGRALFNMNPHDAVERLTAQYEAVTSLV